MKIFVELFHGLGDTVCALPMLKVLRDNYPDAYILIAVKGQAQADIIKSSNIAIDEIILWNVYKNSILNNIKIVLKLRSSKFDYGINAVHTPVTKAKLLMKAVGCRKCIGIQHQLNKSFDDLKDKYHFVEASLLAIKPICKLPEIKIYPKLYVNDESLNKIQNKFLKLNNIKPNIGICIGNGDYSLKNKWIRTGKVITRGWGIENINKLIKELLNYEYNIVLLGGNQEKELLLHIDTESLNNKNLLNLVAVTDVNESIAAASLCNLVVGIDTGMQHIAAASGSKTLSIFGPTNPITHGAYADNAEFVEADVECKYCYGTKMYVECKDRKCLKNISVDIVLNKIREIV